MKCQVLVIRTNCHLSDGTKFFFKSVVISPSFCRGKVVGQEFVFQHGFTNLCCLATGVSLSGKSMPNLLKQF